MSERFIIDCYGIIDTYKELTGYCEKDRLSWSELCNILNELYENVDTDVQKLLLEKEELIKENKNLRRCINEIYIISSRESVD